MQPEDPLNGSPHKNNLRKTAIIGGIIIFLALLGFLWLSDKNSAPEQFPRTDVPIENKQIELQRQVGDSQQLHELLQSGKFDTISLMGNQAVAPRAFAKVYSNKKENMAYLDISGLPEPPNGNGYQLWSFQMEPFEPTSLGMIHSKPNVGKNLHKLPGFTKSGTLCITLEPLEGSKTPTMSQIYVLEMVSEN